MTSKLALLGGPKTRQHPFPSHPVIGDEEKRAVAEVLESGKLSSFLAVPGEYFLGGEKVREFERKFAEYHGVRFAVSFNSATAALHAAVAATGVRPGEEVIVPPLSFTSTAKTQLPLIAKKSKPLSAPLMSIVRKPFLPKVPTTTFSNFSWCALFSDNVDSFSSII